MQLNDQDSVIKESWLANVEYPKASMSAYYALSKEKIPLVQAQSLFEHNKGILILAILLTPLT